jgi:hypothetical protein
MTRLALQHDAVSWTATDTDEVVVLDLRNSNYLSLNASGSLLWTLLADGATPEVMQSSLSDTYGITDSVAKSDVSAFLAALRDRGLLVE